MIASFHAAYQAVVLAAAKTDAAAQVNSWFTPTNLVIALIIILAATVLYYQWRWGKTCNENVQVLVVKADGHGDYALAPQQGGSVALKNPNSGTTRLWPVNKLSTVDVPYPGDGFIPSFLQKTIRQVVVDEEDWEPLLNRSPYKDKVASPDVIKYLQDFAERLEDTDQRDEMLGMADSLSPAPTREMIASPAVLGNLINEKITEAVITVNKETLDTIKNLMNKIGNVVTTNVFYIVSGVLGILLAITMVVSIMGRSSNASVQKDMEQIKTTLGIKDQNSIVP